MLDGVTSLVYLFDVAIMCFTAELEVRQGCCKASHALGPRRSTTTTLPCAAALSARPAYLALATVVDVMSRFHGRVTRCLRVSLPHEPNILFQQYLLVC